MAHNGVQNQGIRIWCCPLIPLHRLKSNKVSNSLILHNTGGKKSPFVVGPFFLLRTFGNDSNLWLRRAMMSLSKQMHCWVGRLLWQRLPCAHPRFICSFSQAHRWPGLPAPLTLDVAMWLSSMWHVRPCDMPFFQIWPFSFLIDFERR